MGGEVRKREARTSSVLSQSVPYMEPKVTARGNFYRFKIRGINVRLGSEFTDMLPLLLVKWIIPKFSKVS